MSRLLFSWSSWAIDHPRRALAYAALLTLLAVPGLARLELRTDGHALVPADDPAVTFDDEVRRAFKLRDPIIVLLESSHPQGIYNPRTMQRILDLSRDLALIGGVGPDNVVSLATERRDRVYPNTLVFRPFLDPFPDTPRLLSLLRSDVEAISILERTLVSADGRAAAILVGAPTGREPGFLGFDRSELYLEVLARARRQEGGTDRILVVGAPVAEALLGTHVQQDLLLLLPVSVLLISLVVWLGCRRVWGVVLGLGEVGGCLVWTFGWMGWMGVPVHLTTALLPVILTTVGVADDIHLLWRYQRVLARTQEPHPAAVRKTMRQMVRPVALTSMTTLVGFLSFNASEIAPIRFFGLFAGVGMLYCILYSLTVLPAALTLLSPERMRHPHLSEPASGWVARLAWPLVRRRRATLATVLALSVAVGLGITRLAVQDGWIDGFAPGSPFRRASAEVDTRLLGSHILLAQITFDWPEEKAPRVRRRQGPLLSKEALDAVGGFEAFARSRPQTGGVLGAHSHLTTIAYLWHGRREEHRTLPEEPEKIDRLLLFFDRVRGEARRREVLHDDLRRTVVTIFLKEGNYRAAADLMTALRGYERQHLAPLGGRLDFAGDVAVSQAMIPAIVRSQIASLAIALAGAFAAICLLYRSLRVGLYALLPPSVAALWMFGIMGWGGIPLGVATSMFFAITLGIGVDYAIHFVERHEQGVESGEAEPVLHALREAGPAITADALAIALGFGILALSQVPSNARLGLLVCVALLASWLLTLVGLGALLAGHSAIPPLRAGVTPGALPHPRERKGD